MKFAEDVIVRTLWSISLWTYHTVLYCTTHRTIIPDVIGLHI